MAKSIATPEGQITITIDDAEKLKRNWGIPLEDEAKADYLTDFGQFKGEQITAMLRPVLERLVMEINRTVSYYAKTFKSERIDELYLSGGSSRMKNIDKFLMLNLEGIQKVKPLNILKAVRGWSERKILGQELMMEQAAPYLAVAFGLCLGKGGQVNLLPMREKLEQKANLLSMLLTFVFPAILVLNLAFYGFTYVTGLKYKLLGEKLGKEYQRLEPQARQIDDYLAKKKKLDDKKALLEKAKGKQPYWMGVFKELSNILPPEVILTRVETVEAKKPFQLVLRGKLYPRYTIVDLALSQLVMTLEDSPYFSQVELVSSKTNTLSREQWAEFEIVCNVNY
jgi:Tfp pilus assembly protein PilN